jgi:hypothetical protein
MLKPLRVYTDKSHGNEKDWVNHLVHPIRAFWGDGTEDWPQWEQDFLFYKNYFEITSDICKSEIGFLPLTLNYYIKNNHLAKVDKLAGDLEKNGQKLIVWIDGDHSVRYNNSNCIFIRYFGQKSQNKMNEIIQPGDMKTDLLNEFFQGEFQTKEKSEKPIIGFDGIANYPKAKLATLILKNSIQYLSYSILKTAVASDPVIPFLIKRKEILSKISENSAIETNFTIRKSFAPGTIGGNNNAKVDFANNIINSDYTFCLRGAANYSLRFYETLCLGRIPMFINTDCILPFEKDIDWRSICLWVDENEIDYINEKILDFHHSMNKDQFKEKQIYCREIWKKYCTNEGFIFHFYESLIESNLIKNVGALA